jgi:hypothetical protein
MKWLRTLVVFGSGKVLGSPTWDQVHQSYLRAIKSIEHPTGTGKLVLRRAVKRTGGRDQRNGVVPLRQKFLDFLVRSEGWTEEQDTAISRLRLQTEVSLYPGKGKHTEPVESDFGEFDFLTTRGPEQLRVAIEWETGNISSSHRSLNKLAIALEAGAINAGVLIVPSRDLYEHLTDRIGNIRELAGYLPLWKAVGANVTNGLLAITVVEHDELTADTKVPYLKVGNDGRAKEGRARRSRAVKAKARTKAKSIRRQRR